MVRVQVLHHLRTISATHSVYYVCSSHYSTLLSAKYQNGTAAERKRSCSGRRRQQASQFPKTAVVFAKMSSSQRPKTLASAGLVALGAGAILCARAYRARLTANASRALLATEQERGAIENEISKTAASGGKGGVPPKTPCEGCDCGLGEAPGPLEGTMNAYERHVIICR